ncbi:UPF0716 protein FxsA [Tumebacillus sp. BK434]|uniref:FxsA family protein n=1 Tax=Tumebacillus sp. BK434 TaxID=2512169 RepID=UPI00104DCE9C|nr:FxsA family protein [Tumebacillus sp. BK434]TCP53755.1 UPF0716 protein FxsA [Tumebacillus sp. BK434]
MKRLFLLLIIAVPALEIFTLIQVGHIIGGWLTFFLVIGMSGLGVYLLTVQGRYIMQQIRREMQMGQLPGDSLLNGACLLVGGTLLLIPGLLSDLIGMLLLLPGVRELPKSLIKLYLMKMMQKGNYVFYRRF